MTIYTINQEIHIFYIHNFIPILPFY